MKAVLLIATRKYKRFIPEIVKQIDRHFLPTEDIGIMIFADEPMYPQSSKRVTMTYNRINELAWPYATLYRYKIFNHISEYLKKFSHLLYLDVDMAIEQDIHSEEIFGDGLTVTRHPGFYALGGWGSHNVHKESKAYIPPEEYEKLNYYAGGTQGGETNTFLAMSKVLAENIDDDKSRGIIAQHNDESHMNHYLWSHPEIERKELTPQYCMVEQVGLRNKWGIGDLPVSIVALDKNHEEMRS